jgi:hypothetical protein
MAALADNGSGALKMVDQGAQPSTLRGILDSSADAVDSLLDIADLADGFLPQERAPLVEAEWTRHAQRRKRIERLEAIASAHADKDLAAIVGRLREKEERRHGWMQSLADGPLE